MEDIMSMVTIFRTKFLCSLLALIRAVADVPAQAHDYDVVVLNGRVIDPETKLDAVRNIGMTDGSIAAIISQKIRGKRSIDATGHVVAPGFIDLHAHGQNIGDYRVQGTQGVTIMLELESGVLPIGQWYDEQAKRKLPINYESAAGWTFARIATIAESVR